MAKAKIRHISGPLAGQTQIFEDDGQRVLIGREPGCRVRYPADFTAVGRLHGELVWDAGRLELRVNTANPVWIDGQRASDGEEVQHGAELRLGAGPAFVVEYDSASALPPTLTTERERDDDDAVKLRNSGRRIKLVAVALLAALAVGVVVTATLSSRTQEVTSAVHGIEAKLGRTVDHEPFAELIRKMTPSVYLIVLKSEQGEAPVGTAWVADGGILVTNAHVVEALQAAIDEGLVPVVRSTSSPSIELSLVSGLLHPGYNAFRRKLEDVVPSSVDPAGDYEDFEIPEGYDVAILKVDDPARLAPPLPIASRETLRTLEPGTALAYVGFPAEGLPQKDLGTPTPTAQVGSIVATTTFTRRKPLNGDGQLIEHSLPATGGASGSPIINNRGEVVAVLNGVSMIATADGRIPNAAQVNFGQRADVVLDLIEHGENLPVEPLQEQWSRDFSVFQARGEERKEKIVEESLAEWLGGRDASLVMDKAYELKSGDLIQVKDWSIPGIQEVLDAAPGEYLLAVTAIGPVDLDLVVTNEAFTEVMGEDAESSRMVPSMVALEREVRGNLLVSILRIPDEQVIDEDDPVADVTPHSQSVRLRVWYVPRNPDN